MNGIKLKRPESNGIQVKKKFGQHFLREVSVVEHMIEQVKLTPDSSVFEIGCGDGVLTQEILKNNPGRLWVFEIDPEWATFVKNKLPDKRLTIFTEDILTVDFSRFNEHKPWILLANLPYQITFPLLHLFQQQRHLLQEGVIMIQEEVAQKLVKKEGRGYGYSSLFFQYYFEWKLMEKVPPTAFFPPPKIYSRLLYFKPNTNLVPIPDEVNFWKFIKLVFHQPRRTIRNNLLQSHYDLVKIADELLLLRAQQLTMKDLLAIWDTIRVS